MRNVSYADPVRDFDRLPDSAHIGIFTVCTLTGKSRATIYRWIQLGLFPPARKIGPGTTNHWTVGEIRRVLEVGVTGPRMRLASRGDSA